MKKPGFFIFSLCASVMAGAVTGAWPAGASPCNESLFIKKPADKPASSAEEPTVLKQSQPADKPANSAEEPSAEKPPEETDGMESMARDAAGGAAAGLALDAMTGGEISPAGIVADAALGFGAGAAVREIAPDLSKELDNFVDDLLDIF